MESPPNALCARPCDRCGNALVFGTDDRLPSRWALCPPCTVRTVKAERISVALRAELAASAATAAAESLATGERKARDATRSVGLQLRALADDLVAMALCEPGLSRAASAGHGVWASTQLAVASSQGASRRSDTEGPRPYRVVWRLTGFPCDPFGYARSLLRATLRAGRSVKIVADKAGEVELSVDLTSASGVAALQAGTQVLAETVAAAGAVAPLLIEGAVVPEAIEAGVDS